VRNETQQTPAAGVVRILPTAPNRENLTLGELADAYMAAYAGRDPGRPGLVALWVRHLGEKRVVDVTPDDVADVLEHLATTPVTKYVGKDPQGRPLLREFGRRAPATINRMRSVVSGLFTFAQKRRLTPRGWVNPCREVATLPGNNERTRFLTSQERERLLRLARASHWPRLYLLVLMAITTGARRGELLGLRYADLDLAAGTAHVRQSKNGGQRVLPLLPAVAAEIRRFGKAAPEALLFGSARRPGKPMVVDSVFTDAVRAARIEDFHFHDLRHSCASYLAQNGATLLEIADVLGHRTLDMVRRYAHLTVQHKAALVNRVLGGIG
jgi:integrase